jgi:hypothetical protein
MEITKKRQRNLEFGNEFVNNNPFANVYRKYSRSDGNSGKSSGGSSKPSTAGTVKGDGSQGTAKKGSTDWGKPCDVTDHLCPGGMHWPSGAI